MQFEKDLESTFKDLFLQKGALNEEVVKYYIHQANKI